MRSSCFAIIFFFMSGSKYFSGDHSQCAWIRPQRTTRGMRHLPRKAGKKFTPPDFTLQAEGATLSGQVIFQGGRAFLPGNSMEFVENKGIKYGAEVALLMPRGGGEPRIPLGD